MYVDISTINHSYGNYLHQLTNWGTTLYLLTAVIFYLSRAVNQSISSQEIYDFWCLWGSASWIVRNGAIRKDMMFGCCTLLWWLNPHKGGRLVSWYVWSIIIIYIYTHCTYRGLTNGSTKEVSELSSTIQTAWNQHMRRQATLADGQYFGKIQKLPSGYLT